MGEIIVDGTGKSYGAKVDVNGFLHIDGITINREDYSSQLGFAYSINTGLITLTNAATKNAVMYVKNNEDFPLILTSAFYQTGASTSGSGNIIVDIVRNPTTGTIISGATACEMIVNKNFGSNRALDVLAYKGATGLTFTDGTKALESILGTITQRIPVSLNSITLQKGSSIGINLTTPTGNTSMAVEFALATFLEVEEDQI